MVTTVCVEADRESGGDLVMCDPCQMPPPGLLKVHEGKCCLSAVPTFRANVSLFIYILNFLQSFDYLELFLTTNLAVFLSWCIFLAFFHNFPRYFWCGVQVVFPDI